MVRLQDLHEEEAAFISKTTAAMNEMAPGDWVQPTPLADSTVAIISTAGLHRRDDVPFKAGSLDYRLIAGDTDFGDVVMSHISTNFDRSAFQEDPNISFPLDRLREMAATGEIGAVANWHYSFMGAMPVPEFFEATGTEVGRLLAADGVDVALLVPV